MFNIDVENGVRYGVVDLNSLADWVWDEFLVEGVNETYKAAYEEYIKENPDGDHEAFSDSYYEPDSEEFSYSKDGLVLELNNSPGATTVWVIKSPIRVMARECSPCCPNAGDLNNLSEDGVETYTLPPIWFDGEVY